MLAVLWVNPVPVADAVCNFWNVVVVGRKGDDFGHCRPRYSLGNDSTHSGTGEERLYWRVVGLFRADELIQVTLL